MPQPYYFAGCIVNIEALFDVTLPYARVLPAYGRFTRPRIGLSSKPQVLDLSSLHNRVHEIFDLFRTACTAVLIFGRFKHPDQPSLQSRGRVESKFFYAP